MVEYQYTSSGVTKEERLMGIVEAPSITSDIFVDRGKTSIFEKNLRLGEINSIGELEIYGYGFFKLKDKS